MRLEKELDVATVETEVLKEGADERRDESEHLKSHVNDLVKKNESLKRKLERARAKADGGPSNFHRLLEIVNELYSCVSSGLLIPPSPSPPRTS